MRAIWKTFHMYGHWKNSPIMYVPNRLLLLKKHTDRKICVSLIICTRVLKEIDFLVYSMWCVYVQYVAK